MFGVRIRLVSGAPISSWVLMGDYLVLGLLALLGSLLRAQEGRERRQIATVFIGTVVGVTPFLVFGVVLPSLLRTDRFLFWGVVPLAPVPYAIVRFHFRHQRNSPQVPALHAGDRRGGRHHGWVSLPDLASPDPRFSAYRAAILATSPTTRSCDRFFFAVYDQRVEERGVDAFSIEGLRTTGGDHA
jgi:hypothetical protein